MSRMPFYRARVEKRPIVVNMPADFMWQEVEHARHVFPAFNAPGLCARGR
jgi:acetolactate synthase-1/2/3 large subunit